MAKEAVVPSSAAAATTVYNSSIHTKRKRTHFSLLLSLSLCYVSASSSAMSTSKSSLLGTIGIGQTRYYSEDEANSTKKKVHCFADPGSVGSRDGAISSTNGKHTPLSKSHCTVSTTRMRAWDGRRRCRFRLCSGSSRDQLTFSDSFCTFDRRQRERGGCAAPCLAKALGVATLSTGREHCFVAGTDYPSDFLNAHDERSEKRPRRELKNVTTESDESTLHF